MPVYDLKIVFKMLKDRAVDCYRGYLLANRKAVRRRLMNADFTAPNSCGIEIISYLSSSRTRSASQRDSYGISNPTHIDYPTTICGRQWTQNAKSCVWSSRNGRNHSLQRTRAGRLVARISSSILKSVRRTSLIESQPSAGSVDGKSANKYKLYNKLRTQEAAGSGEGSAPAKVQQPRKKRHATKPPPAAAQTPHKRSKHLPFPQHENVIPEQAPESAENTPVPPCKIIGPTPQKNGRILGLFDLLTPSSTFRTPSKRQSLAQLPSNVVGTPSRTDKAKVEEEEEHRKLVNSTRKRSKSPPSASKRSYLASFLTPSTRRIADVGNTPEASKPVSALRFDDTPAFLRRDGQQFSQSQHVGEGHREDAENAFFWSPVAVRVIRPKPAGRGLSALVKGLREMEEAKLDEELEMLRDVEAGEGHAHETQKKDASRVYEDSQVLDMPLGPDGQGESEGKDPEAMKKEGMDRNGKPLKIWKKKGQKRTTRRVTIKPNTAKWKPEPEWKGGKEVESDEEVVAVEETQSVTGAQGAGPEDEVEGLDTDEYHASEGVSDDDIPQDEVNVSAKAGKQRGRPKKVRSEPPKERKRKAVSATAHANFRALKLKNKHSKAKGHGRFGRRR
ncbi:MAG: hypothetical protein Q9181_000145 [Wetmoreana brouardii]